MNIDPMTTARARLAIGQALYHHFSDKNVRLVELGFKETDGVVHDDQIAIRFHVHQKFSGPELEIAEQRGLTRTIPGQIGSFQTDVAEGEYFAHWYWGWRRPANSRATRQSPLRGGISISDSRHYSYGTLGGMVIDNQTGLEMILSNWHVLAADWAARPGQRIYQPGRLDGGTLSDTVATLTRDAMETNLDAAVATLTRQRPIINEQVGIGPITGVRQPQLGDRVIKSGRRTNVTYGRVMGVEGVAKIWYSGIERLIRKTVRIEPQIPFTEVSGPGDSGAIWLEQSSRQAIGLHFAGSNSPERALAIDLPAVLAALNVSLVTGTAPVRVESRMALTRR